jgi:hypothetical protein
MFIDGEPAKACSIVYDELEGACRRYAKKCAEKGFWNPNLNLDTGGWANVMSQMDRTLNRSNPFTKPLTPALCARIVGVTTHRNDTGHKPKKLKDLIKRDKELRTRFETAVDLLDEFLNAVKSARV